MKDKTIRTNVKKQLSDKANIDIWKKGINDIKNINSTVYTRGLRGGIRL